MRELGDSGQLHESEPAGLTQRTDAPPYPFRLLVDRGIQCGDRVLLKSGVAGDANAF